MTGTLYRAFTPDLEVRSDGDGRTIRGIAVPYAKPVRIDARLVEQFGRGAANHQIRAAHRIMFAREHIDLGGTLIGATRMLRDDAAGLYGEWRASKTPAGDETVELVRDGALRHLSVGFRERRNRNLPGGIVERVKVDLVEVAVTREGAYGDLASISGVRSAGVTDEWGPDVDDVAATTDGQLLIRQVLAKLPPLLPLP
jgi:HK97 family phage prohead protease